MTSTDLKPLDEPNPPPSIEQQPPLASVQPVLHYPRESIVAAEQREYERRVRDFLAENAEGSD